MIRLSGLLALALLTTPVSAAAQERGTLTIGETVRVEMDVAVDVGRARPTAQGTVVALTMDSLWIETRRSPRPSGYAISELRRIQVPVPRGAGAGAGRGALIGALVGGGLLAFLTPAMLHEGDAGIADGAGFVVGGAAGVLLGLPVGALWGAVRPGSRWLPATLPARSP